MLLPKQSLYDLALKILGTKCTCDSHYAWCLGYMHVGEEIRKLRHPLPESSRELIDKILCLFPPNITELTDANSKVEAENVGQSLRPLAEHGKSKAVAKRYADASIGVHGRKGKRK